MISKILKTIICLALCVVLVTVQVGPHIYCADRKQEYNRNRIGRFYMRSIAQFCNSLALSAELLLVLVLGCGQQEMTVGNGTRKETAGAHSKLNEIEKKRTNRTFRVVEMDSKLYFDAYLEDFIDCYNDYYCSDNGCDYIQPYSEWYSYTQDFGRYKGDMCYEYTADENILTLPTITVYTPRNKMLIKAITVNFDDHSYTEKMYQQYEEMCFYTLKMFFADMDKKELTKLYKKLNRKAYEHIFQKEQGFHSDNPPSDLYYRDGVGVSPYFAYGESVRMCIIPVTQKAIQAYKKKGVKIHILKRHQEK